IALLGWHPSHNQELFTCDELIANFSLSRISKSGACFDIDKAKWFNQKYVQKIEDEVLATHYLLPDLAAQNIACTKSYATKISSLLKKSITFPQELALKSQYFFYPPDKDVLQETFNANGEAKAFLADLLKKLSEVDDFQSAYLQALIQTAISAHSLKKGQAMQIIRLAVTGQKAGPSLAELLEVLGREEVTKRIKNLL
ncbi:MAG: glutamate--tRNA ligase, partial [Bacteroidota bacterium]